MKIVKNIIKILILLIVLFLFIIILDYARLNISYSINKKNYIEQFSIQGNTSNYVPQGLAYSDKYDVVLQTSYNGKHKVSMLYVIDFKTGELLKDLKLIELDDTNNTNHVGGITTDNNTVWITNDYEVNEYSLEEIINTKESFIKSKKNTKLPNRGDFCKYNNNILWIGDFFLNPFYPVPDDNPLLMGYVLDENFNYSIPNYIISLPKMVQGMVITEDNKFVFTTSFTYLINSNLSIYENPLNSTPDTYNLNGNEIAYYKFDKNNLIKKIKLPPMAEGMFYKDSNLYILFESSSDKYSLALPKINKIIKFDIKKVLQ